MTDYTKLGQVKEFWDKEAMPVIKRLLNGQYRLPEIQARFQWAVGEILGKYGVPLNIDMSFIAPTDRGGKNLILPVGCHFRGGRPEVGFFAPVFRTIFRDLRSSKPADFRKLFERDVVIGFMHELDHLVQGIIDNPNRAQVVDFECLAQAATCEHTIRVFTEVYHEELCKDDMLFYSTWVKCGRNAESKDWRDFIAKMYGSLTRGPQ